MYEHRFKKCYHTIPEADDFCADHVFVASELSAYEFSPTNYYADIIERIANGSVNPDNFQKAEINQKDAPSVSTASENSAQFTMVNTDTVADASESVPGSIQNLEQSSDKSVSIDEVAQKYGAQSNYVKKIYNIGSNQDVKQFDSAFERVFNYAQSGTVRLDVVKNLESIRSVLTDKQIELAYETGTAAANTAAKNLEANNLAQANGKNGRKTGVVKGEGVSVEDLKKTFNDNQNIAYKILSTYAEATGIDIVLYQSEMDASGNFQGAQGRFKRGEPGTIYIDINAGLNGKHDVGNLAKYTMLRTFAHEFTHFIEKWNPVQYNEFRKVVFDTLRERGENVDDLVEAKQAAGLSYDMASREVVAEAMTDILPDSHFVQNLAEKHKSIFQKLMEKLKEFVEDLRSYFNSLGKNRSREANALKEQVGETVRYVENIVKMFDQVAEQAVENYQLTGAAEQTAEFSQEQNRGNSERGERYDQGRINGNLQTDSSRLDRGKSPKKGRDGLGATSSEKEWSTLDREKQQQIINQLDAYTYSSEEAEIVLPLYVEGDISNEDIRREAVTEMARQFYEAMQGNRVLLENDGRFRWLGDMVGLLIEDVQAIQDDTFVADEFWEQEQRRDYIDEGYATDSTNWAYENFIIDETDRARFYEVIADLNKRNYSVPRNKNGVYMIEHENKIMFTDGDFKAPTLSKVIVFDTSYEANMAHVKGRIFDEERRTAGHGEAVELLNRMYGDGFIHEYNVRNYQRNDWQDRRGEGSNRRSAGKAGSGRRIFKGQYQERTSPLTDRDVLEAAANDIGISDMSDAEQAALQTFKDRLAELHELQEKRAEAGRLYKEQQFGANVDRQAASQTLERMYELDKQIAAASRKVLGAENSKVLKPILQYVRKSVEKKERERSKAVLERWRDRRDNAEAMTDILPDTHFVQNLAEKHKSIFQKLMEKLKEFVEDLRSYFNSLGKNRSREANALKEQVGETVRYVENIVKMFDQVAEQAVENYQLTGAAEQTAEFSQEQNRGNSERGERYDQGRINGNLQTDSSRLDRGKSPKKGRDGLGATSSEKEWSTLDREKQQQIINQLDAYTYSSEEAEIVLPLYVEGDISNEDIRREAVTEMARQFYEAMQGNRVLLENDGRFRWLGDMVGLLIEDVQAIQDDTFVADEFWEQEQRRDYIDEGYATDSTNWAYENFIIDETDRARFYEVIADLNKRNYSVPRNKNGVYMIEHENKIMFTDGDFKAPTLSKVIVFDTSYEANMAHVKGRIFDEERRTAGHGEAVELLNRMYGDGFIHEYNVRNYQRNDWQDRRGEGSNRRSAGKAGSGRRIFKGQYQERTSPLTDRDVLEAAANDIGISDMSDAEQAALQTFKDRLTELHELQEERAEAGRLYKEQQFGANVDRQAASVVNYLWEQEQRRDYQKYSYKWFVAKP